MDSLHHDKNYEDTCSCIFWKIIDGVIANQELSHQTSYGIISKNQKIIKI